MISAYDVAHQPAETEIDVLGEIRNADLSFVLLDSGGYEVLWNERAVSAGLITAGSAPDWSPERYEALLEEWPGDIPLLAVSYDAPSRSIQQQVDAARGLSDRHPNHAVELLLKPPNDGFDADEIASLIPSITQFPVIGVTEVEIGESMASRLEFISMLRAALSASGEQTPIHVFGGLDPQMTPLYHAAGADIFDGLSWLRYAYQSDLGIYDKSFVAVHSPREVEDDQIWGMRRRNVRRLVDLQIKMTKFQSSQDFAEFGSSGELLKGAWERCWES